MGRSVTPAPQPQPWQQFDVVSSKLFFRSRRKNVYIYTNAHVYQGGGFFFFFFLHKAETVHTELTTL